MRILVPCLLPLAAACLSSAPVEPAPSDFDGNVHYLWDHYDLDAGTDKEIVDAVNKLHTVVKGDTRTDAKMGGITDLSSSDITPVTVPAGTDPSKARGMYLINEFACTLDKLTTITIATNQDVEYPTAYNSYMRTYTSDADAFKAGTTPTLTWTTKVNASLLDAKFDETASGGVRKVTPPSDDATSFGGPILMTRTWMPTPAVFEQSGPSFDQDYQLEVYYERKPGEMIHVYPLWRHMAIPSAGLSTDDDSVVDLITQKLQDWDTQTAKLCAM
jgi:hypothetical protein